jgi:hypothetical protein
LVKGTCVGDRELSRQDRDDLHLRPQLEMNVQEDDQADHNPEVEDEVDAAADADQSSQPRRMVGNPHEIEPGDRREDGQDPDNRRASVFGP